MTKRKLRYSGLGLAVLTVGAVAACSSDNNSNGGTAGSGPGTAGAHSTAGAGGAAATAGAAGTAAGAPGTAGTPGTAGSTGTAGAGGASTGFACANTMPTAALITDFSNLMPNANSAGNFTFTGGVLGGTYTYAPNALTLDTVTNTVLNVKGNVHDYDGFGLYFNTCYNSKTLGYTGISFSIKGNAGPTGKIGFRIQTNSTTAGNNPTNASAMKGTCVATDPSNSYPDCHAAEKQIPVTSTATVITVNFSDLMGGVPVAGVDGSDIVGLEWAFTKPDATAGTAGSGAGGASGGSGGASGGSGGASAGSGGKGGAAGSGTGGASGGAGGAPPAGSFDADITIDDVKFLGGPPAGGAGGAGGTGAGGASGGSGGASGGSGGASGGSGGKAGSGG